MIEVKFLNSFQDNGCISSTIVAGYFKAGTTTIIRWYNKPIAVLEIERWFVKLVT